MFAGAVYGKAQEASDFYLSVFGRSKRGRMVHYPAGMDPHREGTVMFSDFRIENQWFAAMDSAGEHDSFNEAISFPVQCDTQEEIDRYWTKLSAVPDAEQCGWLKDKYGLSWQIVPAAMDEIMRLEDPDKVSRVIRDFLKMKKVDIATLRKAYVGGSDGNTTQH